MKRNKQMKMTMNANTFYRLKMMYPAGFELLHKYRSSYNETSLAKGIPVTPENMFILGEVGKIMKIKRRYRGPRAHSIGRLTASGSIRSQFAAQSFCLKEDATTVAVYLR
jgi:hypothetical protein